MGPTLQVGAAGAAGAAGGAGACAGVVEDESAGAGGGAGACAPAVSAIAIAAPAMDRRIAVVFDCIDTIPPRKDLCMMGNDNGTLKARSGATSRAPETGVKSRQRNTRS